MRTILVTGGTGLVGTALIKHLTEKHYKVIILTRSLKDKVATANVSYALWDVNNNSIDENAVTNADAIFHLAGAGVMDKKWTPEYKKVIEESRTKSSALLVNTLKRINHHVKVIVSSSAIGWYGPDIKPHHFFTEDEPADAAYLGKVCDAWEKSIGEASTLGIRVCKLRTGIVLSKKGGAYAEFRMPLKFGVASILGDGKQMVSWIHIDDLCKQFIFALENDHMEGSYNAVAPKPVNNKTLTLAIAKKVKGSFYIPLHVPTFVLKLMLGQRSIEILKSATVSAQKIQQQGYTFLYNDINTAVAAIENEA
ncbi:TIGR01777 family oxidoreductase [Ferruginibacter yonginensis]|uniref:TIGR01777 family oxidoreductase n=1 Tax=Ferruginibacter yonginensis TaxID=1310416 RepID=A0ABV8QT33_9BACT